MCSRVWVQKNSNETQSSAHNHVNLYSLATETAKRNFNNFHAYVTTQHPTVESDSLMAQIFVNIPNWIIIIYITRWTMCRTLFQSVNAESSQDSNWKISMRLLLVSKQYCRMLYTHAVENLIPTLYLLEREQVKFSWNSVSKMWVLFVFLTQNFTIYDYSMNVIHR